MATAVIVLGPGAKAEVVAHTTQVLCHYGIPFQEFDWRDFPGFLAGNPADLGVIVLMTGIAYTDEHVRLPDSVVIPVIRVVTDASPPEQPEQVLTATGLLATTGFGVAGAVNAGLSAARFLAVGDAALRERLKAQPYPPP
jgi:hypothetical protein